MSFNTVGELIDALQQLNRSTPILKRCGAKYYFDIDFYGKLLYHVKETTREGRYTDCDQFDGEGFDAIVL
jgi:hypothetical protein